MIDELSGLPAMVFTKIADNLECYVKQLEQGGDLGSDVLHPES
jgi:hypothetical protein